MAVQSQKKWRHVSLRPLQILSIGLMPLGMGLIMPRSQGQSSASLPAVCVGIAPEQPKAKSKALQHRCCQSRKTSKCLKWQQIFPAADRLRPPTVLRPAPAAADSFSPRLDEFGNSVGSGGAAKDAVVQVGITSALNAIAPALKPLDINAKAAGSRPNFFQRVRSGYERVLGPRALKSGAILTPQVGIDMDLGQFNVDAMKLGVEIKF
jgi:hypothetical protein